MEGGGKLRWIRQKNEEKNILEGQRKEVIKSLQQLQIKWHRSLQFKIQTLWPVKLNFPICLLATAVAYLCVAKSWDCCRYILMILN